MFFEIADGLNIDPMLVMMALECDTPEELDLVLGDIEREQDAARAAQQWADARRAPQY